MYDSGSDDVMGDFDGKAFNIESGSHTYVEGEFFAAQVVENIPESDNCRIQIGWTTIETPDMPFNMMMAFPTVLTLRTTHNGVRLFNEPVREIAKLQGKAISSKSRSHSEKLMKI